MKPNFALDLSEDGITLLHRASSGAGWYREGRVDFASDDIAAGLAKLRARAVELEGEGFATKLILPSSQLLFTSVDKGADVGAALAQRTPYQADQLSFDDSEDGDTLRVVAVALETLEEAEGFITPHKLNPIGFTAMPAPHQFQGEPMLGGVPIGGEGFEADSAPINIIEKPTFLPDPVAPVEATPEPEDAPPAEPEEATAAEATEQPEATSASEAAKDASAEKEAEAEPTAEPDGDVVADTTPEPEIATPEDHLAASDTAKEPTTEDAERAKDVTPVEDILPQKQAFDASAMFGLSDNDDPSDKAEGKAAPPLAAPTDGPRPAAFSSRRNGGDPDAVAETGKRIKRRATRIVTRILDPETAEKQETKPERKEPAPLAKTSASAASAPAPVVTAKSAKPAPVIKPAPITVPRPEIPQPRSVQPAPTLKDRTMPPAAVAAQLAKADPLAQLAARQQRGKPKYLGLILTCILLVCLGLAALISSFVLPGNGISRMLGLGGEETETVISTDQTDPELIEGPEADLTLEDELELARLTTQEPVLDTLEPEPEVVPPSADVLPEVRPETITEDEALAAYAATGIWQYSDTLEPGTSAAETLDDLYVASLDPSLAFEDAPAITSPPSVDGGEVELTAFSPPPPPGVIFDIDERGLVRATPEGAMNPEGILVFQGRPPIAASPRPVDETAPNAAVTEEITEQNRLAGIRPAPRPSDLVERQERAELGGLTRNELAQVRPAPRPISQQAQAEAIARALAEAEADSPEEAEASLVAATAQAVPQSLRAPARPSNFSATVAQARRVPVTPEASATPTQTASAATASASRGTGPAVARSSRVNPTGPVSSAVARAATDNNALSLGRVSLVGVFGTASNRRALVRMPNGRFKKVSVGDQVDGGRVAAISASSLRYTKSGRTVTLSMPQS